MVPPPLLALRSQGYVDAARAFEKESSTSPGLDLNAITDRMEIRKAMQSGDVEQAIERTNDLDPEVGSQGVVVKGEGAASCFFTAHFAA